MCGIAGIYINNNQKYHNMEHHLSVMNKLQKHRGPDGDGIWVSEKGNAGLAHVRLSIIDIETGAQPMTYASGSSITYNGEIYNYIELRDELIKKGHPFKTSSDTEVILAAYEEWGDDCVNHFRGMFAFAIWDEKRKRLFCARDRFGIKPFYYTKQKDAFYFASEIKALIPFIESLESDIKGLNDYLTFQFCLDGKTLFKDVQELLPAHTIVFENGVCHSKRYWEVYYNLDWDHTSKYFEERLSQLLHDSLRLHIRSDVPIGAYVSGGYDSSAVASIGMDYAHNDFMGFTGKFTYGEGYDESSYARDLASMKEFPLHDIDIRAEDFINNIEKVIYHLDSPVAGPGSFPQYMVSQLASQYRKVVLGGQGGDEIFGGYTRYLIAYFEQCIKGAIDGTMDSGNFLVTYESIIPNLRTLKNYKPLIKKFWERGLFDDIDQRYFRLVNRAPDLGNEIRWEYLDGYNSYDTFRNIFYGKNVGKQSYFDLMTHFDFKTLLPALLQVEDRMSMAHGLESRVPLLDHEIVEFAATVPANIKFPDGRMKHLFINVVEKYLPDSIVNRKDKMGFPVPLTEWIKDDAKDFIMDVFSTEKAKTRPLFDNKVILDSMENEGKFGRKIWGLLSLELWYRQFHDREQEYKKLVK